MYKAIKKIVRYFGLKYYPARFAFLPRPSSIAIEASNFCNLRCLTCPTGGHMRRKRGNMSIETFYIFLNQIDWTINRLNWTFAGEPLMNKKLFEMIRLAAAKGIKSKVDTNGMLLEKYVDNIVASNLHIINVAFEIADKYSDSPQFRVGYDFTKVYDGVKRLKQAKEMHNSKYPIISLNCLVHRFSETKLQEAIVLAKECGADLIVFKSLNINVPSAKREIEFYNMAEKWLPTNPDYLRYDKNVNGSWDVKKHQRFIQCGYLGSTVVLWNGDVTICCLDYEGEYIVGNIHKMPLLSIWRSKRYNRLRILAMKRKLPICKYCTPDIPMKKVELNR